MKLEVIIERSSDGLFSAYAEECVGSHGLAGYGDSVAEALEDFQESIREMNEMRKEEGLRSVEIEITPKYDIESFSIDFLISMCPELRILPESILL